MITVESISKEFPDKTLFKNLSIKLNEGMRVGLVGPNGAGKSTLLKILLGQEAPDEGKINRSPTTSIGYLPQEIIAGNENTILNETLAGLPELSILENEIHSINEKLINDPNNGTLLNKLSNLQSEFEQLGGWDIEKKAKTILSGLGFSSTQFSEPFKSFSGGWRMRCYLASILLKEPNYLFLDEPTNHLDLEAIIWMEDFLSSWNGSLIMISHDRSFLDKSINNILELNQGTSTLYKGNYSEYVDKREINIKHNNKTYENQQKEIAQTEKFIERFRAKNTKAKQVKSKIKQLEKIKKVELIVDKSKIMKMKIPQPGRSPLKIITMTNINKSYDQNLVYDNLNLTIERGQKIALVGENGSGKSTLLKMLAGKEKPTSGMLDYGPKVKFHYFAQHQVEDLDLHMTVYETIFSISKGWTESEIRTYLGSFLFTKDSVQKKVKVLSGGEKSRLALARLLVEPVHLLLLDEPTNHLDIKSRDVMESALQYYAGTMVCISHDRHFLNTVTNLTIEVNDGAIKSYQGNYDYYSWKKTNENSKSTNHDNKPANPIIKKNPYKERKAQRSAYNKLKKQFSNIELSLEEINANFSSNDISSDHEKLNELIRKRNDLEIKYLDTLEKIEEIEKKL
ncbi:MAG: ABC-F family ATP-binding cassette domain-containing protein [Candidatus Neomarinimicrobiota bacterium]|nr:ABC-F family ATP-binding cassette domain-containing protein [Candidatus Neomarinimicrobiota bacterium]